MFSKLRQFSNRFLSPTTREPRPQDRRLGMEYLERRSMLSGTGGGHSVDSGASSESQPQADDLTPVVFIDRESLDDTVDNLGIRLIRGDDVVWGEEAIRFE
jgi:hypothetical protein